MAYGIICEYNPFHNGHKYQIDSIKKQSDEPIVCVMSSHFTQRGELALADKYERARCAIENGADLVLELPFPYCASSAELFASAGVKILAAIGVDKLSFGCESLSREEILSFAKTARSEEFKSLYAEKCKKEGNASAYFSALEALSKNKSKLLSNDILAIEYAKAILENALEMEIYPIKREGNAYLEESLNANTLPSATAIREAVKKGSLENIKDFVPEETLSMLQGANLADIENIGNAILLALRLADKEKNVAVSDEGLVNRILSTAKEATSFAEFEEKVQTKKYTKTAVRRAVWYLIFGVSFDDLKRTPEYTTVLGTTEKGRALLSNIRKSEQTVRVVTKPADAPECRQQELALLSDSLYPLALQNKKSAFEYIKRSPYIK